MSGIQKGLKKVFTKKLVKAVVIGAAIYFAWGAASGAFAEPVAGSAMTLGEGGFTAAESMLGTGLESTAGAGLEASVAETIGTAVAPSAAAPMVSAGTDLALSGGDLALAGGTAPPVSTGGGIVKSSLDFMKANPMATMMAGQGVAGAVEADAADKEREREDAYRRSRGTMGFDAAGNYAGQRPGIVASQLPTQQTTAQRVATPAQQQVRPIQRKNLPALKQQGLIAGQKV